MEAKPNLTLLSEKNGAEELLRDELELLKDPERGKVSDVIVITFTEEGYMYINTNAFSTVHTAGVLALAMQTYTSKIRRDE